MFETHFAGLPEPDRKRLARIWGVSDADPARLTALFRDPLTIRSVLLPLDTDAVRLVLALIDLPETSSTRKQLASRAGMTLGATDAALPQLEERALVLVMKNRSRLDDSADRIHVNGPLRETLIGTDTTGGMRDPGILIRAGVPRPAQLSLPRSLHPDLGSLVALFGGVVPEVLLEEFPGVVSGAVEGVTAPVAPLADAGDPVLLVLDGRFAAARRFSPTVVPAGHKLVTGYRGLAQLAALLGDLRSRPLAVSADGGVRRRDLERLGRRTGVDFSGFEDVLPLLLRRGIMTVRDGELALNRPARHLLAADLDQRLQWLMRNCRVRVFFEKLSGANPLSPHDRPAELVVCRRALSRLQRLAAGLRCFSRLGLVRLRMAGGRVHGWRYHGREEYPEKQAHLTVDGSWGIHVQLTGLAAWERYYLFLMTDLKSSGALVTRALTEKTWFRGISLGIDPDRFRAFLERAAEGRLPDTLRFAIADWTAALRRTRVRRVFLMDADPRTIELFEHDRRLSGFVERIGDGYLVLVTFDERRLFTLLAEHRILLEYGGEETDA